MQYSEFWINSSGDVDYANGDIGDINHDGVVINYVRSLYSDDFDDWNVFLEECAEKYKEEQLNEVLYKDLTNEKMAFLYLKEQGMSEREFKIAIYFKGDPRGYAVEYLGWTRGTGPRNRTISLETWRLDSSTLNNIVNALDEIYNDMEDDEENELEIEIWVGSTNMLYSVPFSTVKERSLLTCDSKCCIM